MLCKCCSQVMQQSASRRFGGRVIRHHTPSRRLAWPSGLVQPPPQPGSARRPPGGALRDWGEQAKRGPSALPPDRRGPLVYCLVIPVQVAGRALREFSGALVSSRPTGAVRPAGPGRALDEVGAPGNPTVPGVRDSALGPHSDHHQAGLDLLCIDDAWDGSETPAERDLLDDLDCVDVRPGQYRRQFDRSRARP